jgi:hypothetical protein
MMADSYGSDATTPIGGPDQSPGTPKPSAPGNDQLGPPPPRVSVLLRELPYVVVLILTLVGDAYMSFSKNWSRR